MKKLLSSLSAFTLVVALIGFTRTEAESNKAMPRRAVLEAPAPLVSVVNYEEKAEELHEKLNLDRFGLKQEVLEYALKGYENLLEKRMINRPGILTVVDFSQSSKRKRLYVLDVENDRMLQNTYVAHGRNSGFEFANRFSNTMESHQSSLGFYETANTYYGAHGLSLRMKGLDRGFNDKAMQRAIVVHGADYVGQHRLGSFMGRSFGCPAVPKHESKKLINTIKDGTVLFIYHPSNNYLNKSSILNG